MLPALLAIALSLALFGGGVWWRSARNAPGPGSLPTPAPATPSADPSPVAQCDPSPSRPSYLPWLDERQPVPPSREERSERDAVLVWFEDPELAYQGSYVSLGTKYSPPFEGETDVPFSRVPVRGVSGYLVWIGDPGVGDVAIIWAEHDKPCGTFQLSTGTRGLSESEAERLIEEIAGSLVES